MSQGRRSALATIAAVCSEMPSPWRSRFPAWGASPGSTSLFLAMKAVGTLYLLPRDPHVARADRIRRAGEIGPASRLGWRSMPAVTV
jgi:hypothetical protein